MKTSRHTSVRIGIKVAVVLVVLLWNAPFARADSIVYSVIFDTILNNANGTWGGNLLIGDNQNLNLTVSYTYNAQPSQFNIGPIGSGASFEVTGLQVFDNTNGLASDLIMGPLGTTFIEYNFNGSTDRFSGTGFGSPGGNISLFQVMGEFGNPGDELPFGQNFDAIVNVSGIDRLIARAPDIFFDNVFEGSDGQVNLQPGTYNFSSSKIMDPIPEPSTIPLFGAGLIGLAMCRWKKNKP